MYETCGWERRGFGALIRTPEGDENRFKSSQIAFWQLDWCSLTTEMRPQEIGLYLGYILKVET